ncbi:MAG TPA: DUF4336 domain-containing protein [Candidatus Acidoferrales bacterium]|nr:DUF4336 domain-containing protein [Candidatus Acidoferrales bacterium]
MPEKRRLIDRLFQLGAPSVVIERRPPALSIADGVWSLMRYLRMPGGPILPSRTTIVRLGSGNLAVISPPPAHEETFAALDGLGKVEALVAPNSFHYLYVDAAARRYPKARVFLAPGLRSRIPSLPDGAEFSEAPVWVDLAHLTLGPVRGLSEVVFFHLPSCTLIFSDVAFNMVSLESRLDRFFWRLNGVPAHFGPSRTARWMLLKDRQRAADVLRRVLDWPFERIVVAHGDVLQADARAQFERGFAAYLRDA